MEAPSTNKRRSKKPAWSIWLYIIVWLLLIAAASYKIWADIINAPPPDPEKIARIAGSNREIEELCARLPPEAQTDCQEKIKKAIGLSAEQSLVEQKNRLWLILLSLAIGLPLLWAAARMSMKASDEGKPFWIVVLLVDILLLVLFVISVSVWNQPDFYIAYAPVPVLEWGFAGGMLAVIHRLSSGRHSSIRRLYPWIVARPVIGLFMGGVIYFIALAAGILTNAKLTDNGQLQKNLWLNAVAFIAAFNDGFSKAVIGRVTSVFVPHQEEKTSDKEAK